MSGIYIPNMEMPKCCYECPIKTDWDTCGYYSISKHIPYKDVPSGEHDILDDCPLIPVPDHGRLIDESWLKKAMITTLEALKKNPKMDGQEMHLIAAFDTLRVMIEDAQTIIPADGKGGAE